MLSSTVFMTVHVFLHILMFLPLIFAAGNLPFYLSYFCSNETFTPQSPYQSNLKDLLLKLSAQASLGQDFYQIPVGDVVGSQVYGSYLCRDDLTDGVCKNCVAAASEQVTERYCPIAKEVLIWYDECMLRYSNRSFFNIVEEFPYVMIRNQANVTEPEYFRKVLQNIQDEFASEAEHGGKSFLTKEVKFTGNLYIYGLMQCTPDLSGADCTECLRQAIGNLTVFTEGKQGGRVLKPSCNIWFYTSDKISAKPPVPIESPPPLSNNYVPGNWLMRINILVRLYIFWHSFFKAYSI